MKKTKVLESIEIEWNSPKNETELDLPKKMEKTKTVKDSYN